MKTSLTTAMQTSLKNSRFNQRGGAQWNDLAMEILLGHKSWDADARAELGNMLKKEIERNGPIDLLSFQKNYDIRRGNGVNRDYPRTYCNLRGSRNELDCDVALRLTLFIAQINLAGKRLWESNLIGPKSNLNKAISGKDKYCAEFINDLYVEELHELAVNLGLSLKPKINTKRELCDLLHNFIENHQSSSLWDQEEKKIVDEMDDLRRKYVYTIQMPATPVRDDLMSLDWEIRKNRDEIEREHRAIIILEENKRRDKALRMGIKREAEERILKRLGPNGTMKAKGKYKKVLKKKIQELYDGIASPDLSNSQVIELFNNPDIRSRIVASPLFQDIVEGLNQAPKSGRQNPIDLLRWNGRYNKKLTELTYLIWDHLDPEYIAAAKAGLKRSPYFRLYVHDKIVGMAMAMSKMDLPDLVLDEIISNSMDTSSLVLAERMKIYAKVRKARKNKRERDEYSTATSHQVDPLTSRYSRNYSKLYQ